VRVTFGDVTLDDAGPDHEPLPADVQAILCVAGVLGEVVHVDDLSADVHAVGRSRGRPPPGCDRVVPASTVTRS
jgi:hypothetical protein